MSADLPDLDVLVERLLEPTVFVAGGCQNCDESLKAQAASEITRLREERATAIIVADLRLRMLEDVETALGGPSPRHRTQRIADLEARALSAETKVERLREALNPFADYADQAITSSVLDRSVCLVDSRAPVTVGDLRKARAVLISETDGSARASRDARSSTRPDEPNVGGGRD